MEEERDELTHYTRSQILHAAQEGNWNEAENIFSMLEVEVEKILFTTQHRPEDEAPLLVVAAKHGHVGFIEHLLALGAELDATKMVDGFHDTVALAASNGDYSLLKVLAETRVLYQASFQTSQMREFIDALREGNFEYVEDLLKDENTEFVKSCGQNLASLIIIRGCPPSCLKVLEDRVDLSCYDCNGYTPLMWAVLGTNIKCINFLVRELKRTVNEHTKFDNWRLHTGAREGRTALMLAACSMGTLSLEVMLQHIGREEVIYGESCALNYAALLGNTESVRLLMKSGAVMRYTDTPGVNVIDHVVQSGNDQCVESVLASLSRDYITTCMRMGVHEKYVRYANVLGVLIKHIEDILIYDKNWDTLLVSASKYGYLESVRILLDVKHRYSPHSTSSEMEHEPISMRTNIQNALMCACQHGHQNVVDLFLQDGADIDFHDEHTKTALIYACENGHHELVDFLVERGADVNKPDRRSMKTALMYACDKGHTTIVNLLVKNGADINEADWSGKTVLMYACDNGRDPIVNLLVEYGVDINKADNCGRTVLINACHRGHDKYADLFMGHRIDVHACDKENKTALIYACEKGYDIIVKLLIDFGADVNAGDEGNKTPLMYACQKGHGTVANLLITHGAKIDAFDWCGKTALIYSCIEGHYATTELLMELGEDVNAKGGSRNISVVNCKLQGTEKTALMYTCVGGNARIVELLLNRGANIDDRDSIGMTSLMMACELGHNDVIDVLMKRKACPIQQDISGRTALMHSCINNQLATVDLLLKDHGVYADARDEFGKSALMLSCQYGLHAIVDALIDTCPSSHFNETIRLSALSYARYGRTEKRIFHEKNPGVDVNAFDKHKQTAMMYIIHGASKETSKIQSLHQNCYDTDPEECFEKCLRTLLSVGADPDCIDTHGDTAFSIAMQGNKRLLEILLESGKLMCEGTLKPVHRDAVPNATEWSAVPLETLHTALKYRTFEWSWCHFKNFPKMALEVMEREMCPGKLTYKHHKIYPLSLAFLLNYRPIVKAFIDKLYFFEDDYTFLTTHCSRMKIQPPQIFSKPLSLQTWSYLVVSKAISLAGSPGLRPERVDALPIFPKLKSKLTFRKL